MMSLIFNVLNYEHEFKNKTNYYGLELLHISLIKKKKKICFYCVWNLSKHSDSLFTKN